MSSKLTIKRLATGVPGLDEVLGGGLPEFSFNLIAGPPGCGKTTLAHQMMFALATPQQTAIYFTAAELVTNAVRHSCPSRIHVAAELTSGAVPPRHADGIRLLVDDDSGAGAVVEGVVGVRDRAEALKGDVVISQASGHFVTEVWIPLSGSPAGGA